jgi:hypothetical protein
VCVVAAHLLRDESRLRLQLFSNLLPRSRAALLVGLDPAACLLAALRGRLGAGAGKRRARAGRGVGFFADASRPEAGVGVVFGEEGEEEEEGAGKRLARRLAILRAAAEEGAGIVTGARLLR